MCKLFGAGASEATLAIAKQPIQLDRGDMRPYSTDLRERVLAAYEKGEGSMGNIASRYGVSRSFVCEVVRTACEAGNAEPRPHAGGRRRVLSADDEERIKRMVDADPTIRVVDLCARFESELGLTVSEPTMWRAMDRMGISRRKRGGLTGKAVVKSEDGGGLQMQPEQGSVVYTVERSSANPPEVMFGLSPWETPSAPDTVSGSSPSTARG